MNIVVIGNGGRENAIIKSLSKSNKNLEIYGLGDYLNPDIIPMLRGFRLLDNFNMEEAISFIKNINPRFVVVGPEKYLDLGISDRLREERISCIGPSQVLSRIETSKLFCRNLLEDNNLGHISPRFFQIDRDTTINTLYQLFDSLNNSFVVKPNGLTGGKGVRIYQNERKEALEYIQELLKDSNLLVLEEYLEGEEFIQLSFCDGKNIIHCPVVKDYKKISKNSYVNTGSMGCIVQKNQNYKNVSEKDIIEATGYNKKVMELLSRMESYGYRGVLYGSYMSTSTGIKLIEFNARFGDPEAIIVLDLLQTDLFNILDAITTQSLDLISVEFSNSYGLCKYLVPEGYPENPKKNEIISIGKLSFEEKDSIYLAGIISKNCRLVTTGSRAIAVCKIGEDRNKLYDDIEGIIEKIEGNLIHRSDICNEKYNSIYEESGVNIEEGNRVVEKIMNSLESTYDENVESVRGDFGGLYNIGNYLLKNQYKEPIMVSSTDGVGTKTIFILENMEKNLGMRILGQDIVNHCINDILVKGAKPLMFLDYFASSSIDSELVKSFVEGVSMSCRYSFCNLMGGETAEMPGVYQTGKIDIVGTIVGVVEKSKMINGKKDIKLGNKVYGLKSNGPHTNGYSLIRKVYSQNKDLRIFPELLTSHKSYLDEIKLLWRKNIKINGLCHITGGGFYDNIPRVLPEGLGVDLKFQIQDIYRELGNTGGIEDRELLTVFNCGYGMLIFVDDGVEMPLGYDYLGEVCEGEIKINC
jgi:phosphoribosylamine--glycine ligase / phosphoribosylformylglycinamidine cyclo-ligase